MYDNNNLNVNEDQSQTMFQSLNTRVLSPSLDLWEQVRKLSLKYRTTKVKAILPN